MRKFIKYSSIAIRYSFSLPLFDTSDFLLQEYKAGEMIAIYLLLNIL